jgi:hypothetical protein
MYSRSHNNCLKLGSRSYAMWLAGKFPFLLRTASFLGALYSFQYLLSPLTPILQKYGHSTLISWEIVVSQVVTFRLIHIVYQSHPPDELPLLFLTALCVV